VEDQSPLDEWQFQILNNAGQSVQVVWSSGTLPVIEWNGRDQETGVWVPKGDYEASFVAWDKSRNESVPSLVSFSVDVSAQEMLETEVLDQLNVTETDLGLIVQIPAIDIFTLVKNRPDWAWED